MMKGIRVKELILLALFADIGFVSKRMIAPFANVITDFLRVPGGIGTAFSLMFIVIGAYLIHRRGAAALMSLVQCVLALSLGMSGAMGMLSPIGYIVPGIVIDLVIGISRKADPLLSMCAANMAGSIAASLTANFIVFHLHGAVLALYLIISMICGGVCGMIARVLAKRLSPLYRKTDIPAEERESSDESCTKQFVRGEMKG